MINRCLKSSSICNRDVVAQLTNIASSNMSSSSDRCSSAGSDRLSSVLGNLDSALVTKFSLPGICRTSKLYWERYVADAMSLGLSLTTSTVRRVFWFTIPAVLWWSVSTTTGFLDEPIHVLILLQTQTRPATSNSVGKY